MKWIYVIIIVAVVAVAVTNDPIRGWLRADPGEAAADRSAQIDSLGSSTTKLQEDANSRTKNPIRAD